MNKRGSFFFTFMLGLTVLLLGLYLAPSLKQSAEIARGGSGLDCANSSISTVNKVTCVATDVTTFYFVGGIIFLAGVVIGARVIFGGPEG